MKNERLNFDEAYDVAQQANIDMIHEVALSENKRFNAEKEG